jgi:hypothetical protein
VVSDHGQSQGDTFAQLGETLADLVKRLTSGKVEALEESVEGYSRLRALAEDLSGGGPGSATARRAADRIDRAAAQQTQADTELVVLGSGNLGLVFVPGPRRLLLGELDARWPNLVAGLVANPGVGCIVADTVEGPVAVGASGVLVLRTGELRGDDPLAHYGPGALERLRPAAERDTAPDLYVISSCDPATGDVHAFEELVGSHGGLGGWQDRAVLLAPTSLSPPGDELLGADQVHRILTRWRRELGHDVAEPVEPPAAPPPPSKPEPMPTGG